MAHIQVLYGKCQNLVDRLMTRIYVVDLQFCNQKAYDDAVKLGFDKVVWEKKNNNKIIIKDESTCTK